MNDKLSSLPSKNFNYSKFLLFSLKVIPLLSLAVSGIDIHMITPITCICCIFYTCVGGIKAGLKIQSKESASKHLNSSLLIPPVIYTDVVQSLMMFGAMFLVIIKGTIDIGGLDVVLTRNVESQRIEPPEYVNCY